METVIVEIHKGKTKISVNGAKGKACEAITRDLENALGSVSKREHTSEYKQATASAKNRAVQR